MTFGAELSGQRNLCSEASRESALVLKNVIGSDHFRDSHVL